MRGGGNKDLWLFLIGLISVAIELYFKIPKGKRGDYEKLKAGDFIA
jgi:hypothetical protein